MTGQDRYRQLQGRIHRFFEIISMIPRGAMVGFSWLPIFGVWIMFIPLALKIRKMDQHNDIIAPQSDTVSPTDRQRNMLYLSNTFKSFKKRFRKLWNPTSDYIPMLASTLGLLYAFRAMDDHELSLPNTGTYHTACPEEPRRTVNEVFVKLFAATVTTIGVHGHLNSLKGSKSWKRELFRAFEICMNPLATVITFGMSVWYGFIDLLMLNPGPWKKGITGRYRLARLCGCSLHTELLPRSTVSLPLGLVSPYHVEAIPLQRDLTWGGRVLVLLILLGQYSQAATLLTRRILVNSAAGVDYAMIFLVLSGLVALVQSLVISFLNASWTLRGCVQPCEECLCSLPQCIDFKRERGIPSKDLSIILFGQNITHVPRMVLYQLVGGFIHVSVVFQLKRKLWQNAWSLLSLHLVWQSTLYYTVYIKGFLELMNGDTRSQSTNTEQIPSNHQHTDNLPVPISQEPRSKSTKKSMVFNVVFTTVGCFIGLLAIAWLFLIIVFQLFWLLGPCVGLYIRIAVETSYWKEADANLPCPGLWKDALGDELWWF